MKLVIVVVLFILALGRSFYHLPHSTFDADEEYFAMSGRSILAGKLTLIGQQTSVGELYQAPLFNYLIAGLMYVFGGNPLVIRGAGAVFGAITIPLIFVLGQKITSSLAALFSALLVLASDSFLGLESFSPNLTPLTLIVLIYLWIKTNSWSRRAQSLALGSLVGLSAHFHIIGLMLTPLLISTGWWWLAPFLFFLSPLILFDFRHDFLIAKHAIDFLFSQSGSSTPITYRIHTYLIALADQINFLFPAQVFIPVVILIILWVFLTKSVNPQLKNILILPLIYFSIYPKHLVPYYSIVAWTPLILIVGLVLTKIWELHKAGKLVVMGFLAIFLYQNTISWQSWRAIRGIDKKIAALEFIKQHAGSGKKNISKTIELSANFGFNYLMDYVGLSSTGNPQDRTYTIVVPANWDKIRSDIIFGDIGIVLPDDEK